MSVVAEFTVPTESFALAHTLDAVSDIGVEADRMASHSREWVLPLVWMRAEDTAAVQAAMDDDPSVVEHEALHAADGETLYRVLWSERVRRFVDAITDRTGVVLTATADADGWELSFRFANHDALAAFQAEFRDRDADFALERVVTPTEPRQREYGLTPEQYETLTLAVKSGYYDVPRTASTADLADELGVSANAVSERLRRGTATLVTATLGGPDEHV